MPYRQTPFEVVSRLDRVVEHDQADRDVVADRRMVPVLERRFLVT